jgi:hypothetical protein
LLVGAARAEDEPEKTDPARLPPQPGDHFVFLSGPSKGQVVRLDNLAMGGPQVQVFPASPDGAVQNGTPLNLVILARFDPAELSEETSSSADGSPAPAPRARCTKTARPDLQMCPACQPPPIRDRRLNHDTLAMARVFQMG